MLKLHFRPLAFTVSFVVACSATAQAEETIIVQSTTSTANSGFYDYITPIIARETGVTMRVVAVGTGQALANSRRCDGDLLIVHSTADELAFVADGFGTYRADLMYNDFVLVGPSDDPAKVADARDVTAAMVAIAAAEAPFMSRGDDSGTHTAELRLWDAAGVDPKPASGAWYRETGSGMGATLNIAAGQSAYTMTDRATWARFANRGDLVILFEGDKSLFNQYGILPVDSARCPTVKAEAAEKVSAYLLSDDGQAAIAAFQIDGQPVFFPNGSDDAVR